MRTHKLNKSSEAELRILGMKKNPFIVSFINFIAAVFFVISNVSMLVVLFSFLEVIVVFVLANYIAEHHYYSSLSSSSYPKHIINNFF